MRRLGSLAGVLVLAACGARTPVPRLTVPTPIASALTVSAAAAGPIGGVQPVEIAITNGRPITLRLETRQIFALGEDEQRVAPLVPAEAARRAGGRRLPAARYAAIEVAKGSVLGAASGAIWGGITGGSVGLSTAGGSAVGALGGLVGSLFAGAWPTPDVAGFDGLALRDASLAQGFSAGGFVYYPQGEYHTLELLVADAAGAIERLRVPIAE